MYNKVYATLHELKKRAMEQALLCSHLWLTEEIRQTKQSIILIVAYLEITLGRSTASQSLMYKYV